MAQKTRGLETVFVRYLRIVAGLAWFNLVDIIIWSLDYTGGYILYSLILIAVFPLLTVVPSFLGALPTAVFIELLMRRLEATGRIELILHRNRRIPKKSFKNCDLTQKWDEYFTTHLRMLGFAPISYPLSADSKMEAFAIPAYEIARFADDESMWPEFRNDNKQNEGHTSEFRRRFVKEVETPMDIEDRFSEQEIEDFRKMIRAKWWNGDAMWIVGVSFGPSISTRLTIHYTVTKYYSSLVLVNDLAYMIAKFPKEPDYPVFMVERQLPNLRKLHYDELLTEIPAILGVEVIVVTKDGKLILQKRSSKEAVNRGKITSSASAGYRPEYIAGTHRRYLEDLPMLTSREALPVIWGALRQVQNELGLHVVKRELDSRGEEVTVRDQELEDIRLLGLVHVVPTSEFNFVVSMRTNKSSKEVRHLAAIARKGKKNVLSRTISEVWEHDDLLVFDLNEIKEFRGRWKEYFWRNRSNLDRAVVALHYACTYA